MNERLLELEAQIAIFRQKRARRMVAARERGATFAEIGERFGVTRQRAHQIVKQRMSG